MTRRILFVLVVAPVAIVLIALAVANRTLVPLTIDPFNPGNPALTIYWPLFVYLFIAVALGIVLGGSASWIGQHHYRRQAREKAREAERMKIRAEDERKAREQLAAERHGLPAPVR